MGTRTQSEKAPRAPHLRWLLRPARQVPERIMFRVCHGLRRIQAVRLFLSQLAVPLRPAQCGGLPRSLPSLPLPPPRERQQRLLAWLLAHTFRFVPALISFCKVSLLSLPRPASSFPWNLPAQRLRRGPGQGRHLPQAPGPSQRWPERKLTEHLPRARPAVGNAEKSPRIASLSPQNNPRRGVQ